MEIPYILRQIGLNDKEIRVYLALLSGGACSAKRLTKDTELTKYAVNEAVKRLRELSLISAYQKHKKQQFVAENPEKLMELAVKREQNMSEIKRRVNEMLPELKTIYAHGGNRTSVKYYEGMKGLEIILKDVLTTMSEYSGEKNYRVFSSSKFRQFIYDNFPNFTKDRINREIHVRILVMGEERPNRPLMEQKTIPVQEGAPNYSIIYANKVAFISLDENELVTGFIIEDSCIAQTQQIIFEQIWNQSAESKRIPVEATIAENL